MRHVIETNAELLLTTITYCRQQHGRCTVEMVGAALGLSRNTAWRRLRELVDEGLVECLDRGGYRLVDEQIKS